MKVRFRKSPAGQPHVMSCVRADGSETYGPIPPQAGIPHDLIHFVVEQTLGLDRAFFGTIATGVGIPDAAEKWKTFDASRGITLGSLIHWAQEDGWIPPSA